MAWTNLIPPNDLLKKLEGVEGGLRQRRRISRIALLAAAIQGGTLILSNDWWKKLLEFWSNLPALDFSTSASFSQSLQQVYDYVFAGPWQLFLILFGTLLATCVASWSRFWIKESQAPFRYTCSIDDFKPVTDEHKLDRMAWLSHHLSDKLSERIRRLYLLDDTNVKATQAHEKEAKEQSHIHIQGYYLLRAREDPKGLSIEVMPRVRIGPAGEPETLAHPVEFRLTRPSSASASSSASPITTTGITGATTAAEGKPPSVSDKEYEAILERVYFSVATEIYKRIQQDVRQKIDLLPTQYFKAVAYFHEAEDYAASNTLDAYDEARKLYEEAFRLLASSRPGSTFWPRVAWQHVQCYAASLWFLLKRKLAHFVPVLGHVELLCARAEIGFANMILYRRKLAGISGQRLNPVYEAPSIINRAIQRLEKLPKDVPGHQNALFQAYVTRALTSESLEATEDAQKFLNKARRLDPRRTEEDADYLFVAALVAAHPHTKLQLFRMAVELKPRFEAALFLLAGELELLWRNKLTLEGNVAESVCDVYGEVLRINPGNISSWERQGYIRWLLGKENFFKAGEAFKGGGQYKEIVKKTFMAAIDYGRARLAAEQGDFEGAYTHYINGVSAELAQGVYHNPEQRAWRYRMMTGAILRRFAQYRLTVRRQRRAKRSEDGARIRDSIYAFVLTEYGEACFAYHLRSGDQRYYEKAQKAFESAITTNNQYLMPHYHLGILLKQQVGDDASDNDSLEKQIRKCEESEKKLTEAMKRFDMVERLAPKWPDGILARAEVKARLAYWNKTSRRKCLEQIVMIRKELKKEEDKRKRFEFVKSKKELKREEDEQKRFEHGAEEELSLSFAKFDPKTHDERIEQYKKEVERLRQEAKERRKHASDLLEKSCDHLKEMLPYEWAESVFRNASETAALMLLLLRKDVKWDKLDELHASALFTLGMVLSLKFAGRVADQEAVKKLFWHIRDHFWPGEFGLFVELRTLLKNLGSLPDQDMEAIKKDLDQCNGIIRNIIREALAKDPANWAVMTWVDEETFGQPNQAQQILSQALELSKYNRQLGLVPEFYVFLGNQFFRYGRWDHAREMYTKGEKLIHLKTHCHYMKGKAWWSEKKYREAIEEFDQITWREGTIKLRKNWRTEIVGDIERSVLNKETYYLLKSWIRREQERCRGRDGVAETDTRNAKWRLAREQYQKVWIGTKEVRGNINDLPLLPTPIVLRADETLFPKGDEWAESHPMFTDHIPAMRDRLKGKLGVRIPGVRVQAVSGADRDSFWIQIYEIEVFRGRVDRRTASVNGDGEAGALAQLVQHLERVLEAHAASFLDLQGLYDLFNNGHNKRNVYRFSLKDKLRLLKILRALLDEGVTVKKSDLILGIFQQHISDDIKQIVEAVRLEMKNDLPGNNDHCSVYEYIDVSTMEDQKILERLRETRLREAMMNPSNGYIALVTRPDRRSDVHRAIKDTFPGVPVLSTRELWSELQNSAVIDGPSSGVSSHV